MDRHAAFYDRYIAGPDIDDDAPSVMAITTLTDLQCYVHDRMGEATMGDVQAVTRALQAAEHPPWGSDWSGWLSTELPRAIADYVRRTDLYIPKG